MYQDTPNTDDREAEIDHFVRSYVDKAMRRMEFRFFMLGQKWCALWYRTGSDFENFQHAGEITQDTMEDAVSVIYQMAELAAEHEAIAELRKAGVR